MALKSDEMIEIEATATIVKQITEESKIHIRVRTFPLPIPSGNLYVRLKKQRGGLRCVRHGAYQKKIFFKPLKAIKQLHTLESVQD
jgi:hypothetical protein